MTSATDHIRAEIEQILLAHPRTRYAKVLEGMKRNLTDAEMADAAVRAGEPVTVERIAEVRRIVSQTLDDHVATRSEAEMQAGLYRELLNYRLSPETRQHVITRLTQLRALDPAVKLTPLGDVRLGANGSTRPEQPEVVCQDCYQVHAGECL
ncbi:hypothetical protein MMUR_26660 [Mycolicibacterium murale]|uniref:Uncharacterized protein n=1 Tax=Mycolicibacterium murale TaxID=182220 RepID=A0A7I9WMF9_9MYCO|nr:hypothetical protein [Mycolicibacterium murale]MCV7181131.1 hypothetical protein [Mycolicibacterium murale]GFG58530.1 hypothetical protein MMUR_26660 [Mycolicibacterium murale]